MRSYLCLSNMSNLCVIINTQTVFIFVITALVLFLIFKAASLQFSVTMIRGDRCLPICRDFRFLLHSLCSCLKGKNKNSWGFSVLESTEANWLMCREGPRHTTGEKRQGGKTTAWTPNYALVPVYKHPHMSRVLMSHTYRFLVLLLKPELTTVFVFACR